MITTTNGLPFERPGLPSFAKFVESIARLRAARRERSRVVRELNAYSDAELRELGLFRGDIPAVADGTYRR